MEAIAAIVCTLGKVRAEWATRLATAGFPVGAKKGVISIGGMPTTHARNLAVKKGRELEISHLLFWDDDLIPENGSAPILMYNTMKKHGYPILTGIYPNRNPDFPEPIVLKEDGEGGWWGWQDGKVHKVFFAGTAFTLIDMAKLPVDVPTYEFQGIEMPNYFHDSDLAKTDDMYFAHLLREYGVDQYVHGGVRCMQIDLQTGRYFALKQSEDAVDGIADSLKMPIPFLEEVASL